MHTATFASVFALIASVAAAPAAWSDPTVCAPGTGYYQVCASGFRGCCTADACGLGYCPTTSNPPPTNNKPVDDGTCPAGKNYYVCSTGFRGCCSQDACTIGYCPDTTTVPEPPVKEQPPVVHVPAPQPENGVCAAGTGYYQVCANGFKGCCTADACGLGYCPSTPITPTVPEQPPKNNVPAVQPHDGVCPTGTGYYQVCANGFKGCCTKDACGLGYCPY